MSASDLIIFLLSSCKQGAVHIWGPAVLEAERRVPETRPIAGRHAFPDLSVRVFLHDDCCGTGFEPGSALAKKFHICSHGVMTPDSITQAILSAPGWARVGLIMRNRDTREKAAQELARSILEHDHQPLQRDDMDQLELPFSCDL